MGYVAWMAIGFVLLSLACAAALTLRLRQIGMSRAAVDKFVAGGMLVALVAAPVAFAASSAIASLVVPMWTPGAAVAGFSAAILGTAIGTVCPYVYLERRAVRHRR